MNEHPDRKDVAHVTVAFCPQCIAAINNALAEAMRERCIAALDWQLIEALQ